MNRFFTLLFAASCLTSVGQVPDYVPTDGLVGWWPLDNSPANASSSDLQGSIDPISSSVLVAGQNRFGEASKCIDFSGNVSRITIPDSDVLDLGQANTNSITYALWFRRTAAPSNAVDEILLTKGAGSSSATRDYRYWHENNPNSINEGLVEVTGDGGYDCTRHHFGVLSDEDWHHLVVSSSNAGDGELGSKVVWLDGMLFDSCSYEVKGPSNGGPLYLGGEPGYSNFLGLIDDVGMWDRMLSSDEVDALYNWVPNGGCTDEAACNYNSDAQLDDGSCHFNCEFCQDGTIWDEEIQGCISANTADINNDGCVQLNDLLDLLSAYGDCGAEESPWQCGDPLEYQGYDYETVQIGEQCWFAENLNAAMFLNGESIPTGLSEEEWASTSDNGFPAFVSAGAEIYYNHHAVTDPRELCPSGWRVPGMTDWDELSQVLGGSPVAGRELKSDVDWDGTNSSGFTARPLGQAYDNTGVVIETEWRAIFWTSQGSGGYAPAICLESNDDALIQHGSADRRSGFSVRCIKDAE